MASPASGHETTRHVRGRVVDADRGEPIAGVRVRVDGTAIEGVTDEGGRFAFANVPIDRYVVVADGPAIKTARASIPEAGSVEPIVVRVSYASQAEPTVAVVTARSRRRPRTASTTRVTAREMAAVPRRNAEDALRLVPGLTLVQHGSEGKGHQFFLRGFDAIHGADLELTVEGIPVNEWSNIHAQGYIDLGFIIPETIDSVEVTKGPFTLDQGAFAMAGSANYRLGIARGDRGLRSTYTVGTTNRQRGLVTYSPADGDGRDFIAAEAMHDDGFGQNRGIDRSAVLGRVRLFDNAKHGTLSLLGSSYVARFELPGTLRDEDVQSGRVGFYDSYDHAGRGLSARGLLSASHEWRNARHEVSSTAYAGYRRLDLLENYTGFLVDPVNGDRRGQTQRGWSFGANVAYDLRLTKTLGLDAGLGVRGDVLEQVQEHLGQQEQALELERGLQTVQTISHALVGLGYRPVRALRLAVGTRLDVAHVAVRDDLDAGRTSTDTLPVVLPRATAEWRVVTPLRLFAAYGRGFRPPEARAFTTFETQNTGVSEDLFEGGEPRMTVADSFELGARWRPSRYFGGSLSGFATLIERETIFDHVSGVNLELNGTRRVGAELGVHSNPTDWLILKADITYVDARFVESGNPVVLAPRLLGGARAIVSHDSGFRGGLRFFGFAPRPLPHGAMGAPMAVLDATAGYSWRRLRLDLEVENLLNRQIREGEYHYASHWRRGEQPSAIPVVHYVAGPPLNARLSMTAVF